MHRAILVATVLLLAACNSSTNWTNQQAQLANEANPSSAESNDVNATAPAATNVNAVVGNAAGNDVNAVAPANEAAPHG
jgi:hypothetical protein